MKCAQCGSEAVAICKFCGRAVCAAHLKTAGYASGFGRVNKDGPLVRAAEAGILVADAAWCGQCKVEYMQTY